jgi:hypothetical protein
MRASWPGLILAPLFALADQSVTYAMVQWSCETQRHTPAHFVHLAFLVLTLASAWMAWTQWHGGASREDSGDRATVGSFVAGMATLVALLSAAVIAALWIPQWLLSPCFG